jgi:hypothetical protein
LQNARLGGVISTKVHLSLPVSWGSDLNSVLVLAALEEGDQGLEDSMRASSLKVGGGSDSCFTGCWEWEWQASSDPLVVWGQIELQIRIFINVA